MSYARREAFGTLRHIADGRRRGAVGVRPSASCGCLERTEAQAALGALSARELEVLALAGDGLSNQEIAKVLTISRETAKDHLHSIYGKLEVRSRIQAAKIAWQAGLSR
ncbi:response regulator transcription factor [Streptomyces sp. NPDC004393]|uniref:response regulator transcription factor n=1 Tax=Streptomyces sp. NPDC004533 TaxID=3154278 RepID=UPI0033AEFB5C